MSEKDIHKGHRSRMKERFLKEGAKNFRDHELLELLLYYSIPRKDTNETAHLLLNRFRSLSAVFEADFNQLSLVEGLGENSAFLINLIAELKRKISDDELIRKTYLKSTEDIKNYVSSYLTGRANEILYAVCLDAEYKVVSVIKLSEGTEDTVTTHPRKIIEAAILHKAHFVILAHNHPGGISYPSNDDIMSTRKIAEILKSLDLTLLDHIVVGAGDIISLKSMNIF